MADQPSTLPEWATDETNNTEPSLAQKQAGWGYEQEASSSFFNWWMRLVYLWIVWLSGAVTRERTRWLMPEVNSAGGSGWTFNNSTRCWEQSAASNQLGPIYLPHLAVGDVITGLSIRSRIDGAGTPGVGEFTALQLRRTNGATDEIIGPALPLSDGGSTAWQTWSTDPGLHVQYPHTVAADYTYYLQVASGADWAAGRKSLVSGVAVKTQEPTSV